MDFEPVIVGSPWVISQTGGCYIAGQLERRSSSRKRTVYRLAHVETTDDGGLARVHNFSDTGLGLKLHIPVMLGDAMTIRLTEDITVVGHVVWTHGTDCGVQLSNSVDSVVLLREMAAHKRSDGGRPLRIPVNKAAVARTDAGLRRIEIQDVSQNGMKVEHDGSFQEGMHVKILLESGLERRGVVRWSHDRIAGLILLEPFSASELGSVKNI